MTVPVHRDVVAIARRVSLVDADTAIIDGHTYRREGPGEFWLRDLIYERCVVRPAGQPAGNADSADIRAFRESLSDANCGRGTWESGWTYESDNVACCRNVRFSIRPGGVREEGTPLMPGSACAVRVPKERRNLHPGFYFMLGDESWSMDADRTQPLVRVYWNVRRAGAARLVAAVSRELNRRSVPFCAKVLDDPAAYVRADAGVLYLPSAAFARTRDALAAIHADVRDQLRAVAPMFTAQLAPGAGVAEDPRDGLSFSQHRSAIVARGLMRSLAEDCDGPHCRARLIAAEFRREGIDPARPFRSASSGWAYIEPDLGQDDGVLVSLGARSGVPRTTGRAHRRLTYLEVAARIGERLCREAFWNRDAARCTWLGRTRDATGRDAEQPTTAASLGPYLYDGLAGVALFLAELCAQTGNEEFRRTALGALASAHRQLRQQQPGAGEQAGLYVGTAGIDYVTWRVRSLTGQDTPRDRIAGTAMAGAATDHGDDLTGGRAGAIAALLTLGQEAGVPSATEHAGALGEALCASMRQHSMLTGLAHGAAGYAFALLALYSNTGRAEFLDAARNAMTFENALFDDAAQNWPDLRKPDGAAPGDVGDRFIVTWCNGAAGIAISRLRAMTADPEFGSEYARQARTALTATQHALTSRLANSDDVSLCHGIAGLVETLWFAGQVLDDADLKSVATTAMDSWLGQLTRSEPSYNRIVLANPGLMLGAAGIGHQCLRMHDPLRVRSVLAGPWPTRGARQLLPG